MENASSITLLQPDIDVSHPHPVFGAKLLTYYVAIGAVLVVAWLIQPKKQCSTIPVPFYKAPKTKWIFSAETLVKDSYRKVCSKLRSAKGGRCRLR